MQQNSGLLFLPDPSGAAPKQNEYPQGLVFHENESLLSQAQGALWRLRKDHEWICVAAQGEAACIALALAAQLPVERVAILGTGQGDGRLSREMRRLKAYARRNLALVTAEILLVGVQDGLIHTLLRGMGRCRLCALEELPLARLTAPWEVLCENNLLIQGKCV